MATHSSILAWKFPWTEEPDGLQSTGLQRVRQDWAGNTHNMKPQLPGKTHLCLLSPPYEEVSPVLFELFQPKWELLEALLTVGLGHSTWVSLSLAIWTKSRGMLRGSLGLTWNKFLKPEPAGGWTGFWAPNEALLYMEALGFLCCGAPERAWEWAVQTKEGSYFSGSRKGQ